jgi:hypothetical protein
MNLPHAVNVVVNVKGTDDVRDLDLSRRIILEWIQSK